MGRYSRQKSRGDDGDTASEVSELSHDSSAVSNGSRSTALWRMLGGKVREGNKLSDEVASVGSASERSRGGGSRKTAGATAIAGSRAPPSRSASNASAETTGSRGASSDEKRLAKEAKSRFNIGLVYLKTGDHAKAQENLEHSLFCHTQLSGCDVNSYSDETVLAVAVVREKLGDCYACDTAIADVHRAREHWEESRRLLDRVRPESAPANLEGTLQRVEEKLKRPEYDRYDAARRARKSRATMAIKYQMEPNDKAKALLGMGAAADADAVAAVAAAAKADADATSQNSAPCRQHSAPTPRRRKRDVVAKSVRRATTALGPGGKKSDIVDDGSVRSDGSMSLDGVKKLELANMHLDFENHHASLNHLSALQDSMMSREGGSSVDDGFRGQMVESMLKLAASALEANKLAVAADSYQGAYEILKREDHPFGEEAFDSDLALARKGCIKCHKLLAMECEGVRSYCQAIPHRRRAYELLDEAGRTVPACEQQLKIAHLHAEDEEYAEAVAALSEAIGRLRRGAASLDEMPLAEFRRASVDLPPAGVPRSDDRLNDLARPSGDERDDRVSCRRTVMARNRKTVPLRRGDTVDMDSWPPDRVDLLVHCHQMQAICYAKWKRWDDALAQYDKVLPLVAKREAGGGREFNATLIHKSALLVTMGNHRAAAASIDEYLKRAESSHPQVIVDDADHLLALDTSAATCVRLGLVGDAISAFERKLAFARALPGGPDNDEAKRDTMHKLGCLLASRNEPERALALLNEALGAEKFGPDGKRRSMLKTTLAVAATNCALGDNGEALKEYSVLSDEAPAAGDVPADAAGIHNSAGKLFFEEGRLDEAVRSLRRAFREVENSRDLRLKSEIMLNLANALSARGEADEAMELYGRLLGTKSLKKTKISFLARFNKSLLLIKMGEVEKAKGILDKLAENSSPAADDVRGNVYLTLGTLAASENNLDEAVGHFEKSVDAAGPDDFGPRAEARRSIAMAQLGAGKMDEAISTLEGVLGDLFGSGAGGRSVNLLTAEMWNCLVRVHKKRGDIEQAKSFANLALQTYRAELGETDPITLRNVSNLQLLLLEEAEGLEQSEAKATIDAAKVELEKTLEAFELMNGPETAEVSRLDLDVVSVKTNLGFIAVWMRKPKKARKLVSQVKEMELPPDHPLSRRIAVLEGRVEELEKKKKK